MTVPVFLYRDSMKCPDCGQYSLTYDYYRNGWVCEIYNGFIPAESWGNDLADMLFGALNTVIDTMSSLIGVDIRAYAEHLELGHNNGLD